MTDYLIDLASYQEGIDLDRVKEAGYTKVNVKLSQGNWYQWSRAGYYLDWARDLGFGISTFHWLDGSASGAEQARVALDLMRRYGVLEGTAHQCDCEDSARPATWAIWRDYMTATQDALGRHVASYTGDWWWTAPGRNWNGSTLTPFAWAAPNGGYRSSYPGDDSPDWICGYGGWPHYALLQYAVQPISGAGGGDLSKTAIRDPAVWAALTGGSSVTQEEHDALIEVRDRLRWIDPRMEALVELKTSYIDPAGQEHDMPIVKQIQDTLTALTEAVASLEVGGIDYAALAKAVADEQARRLES